VRICLATEKIDEWPGKRVIFCPTCKNEEAHKSVKPLHMLRRVGFLAVWTAFISISGWAQTADSTSSNPHRIKIDGEILATKVEGGDTLLLADLDSISVTSFRSFESDAEYRRYLKYRRYASSVYPYAVEAVKIFQEVQRDTDGLKKGKRKKHVRNLQQELKEEFTDPLKDLSRTQGKILIEMIERKLDTPIYDLLKSLRGGFVAGKWQSVGKLYGYDLKDGYKRGEDPILDAVLEDFEITYEVE
jgi:hypothetical protein